MSATYSPSLASDVDWVRFLVGDTDITSADLQDEEIAAMVAEVKTTSAVSVLAALKYLAAARCLEKLFTQWSSSGKGVLDIKIGRLEIRDVDGNSIKALESRIADLRERGVR